MRASVLHAPGDLRVEERPVPAPGPGDVLVQVGSVGSCGSDTHYYRHGRIGDHIVREPLVLGHEAGGVVVGVGAGVAEELLGVRVSVEPGIPCGRCAVCRRGTYNLCPDVRFFATPPVDGAFCEYVVVPSDFAYAVPDVISDDAAGLIEPLSVALWACRKGGVRAGCTVLVAGAGPIGLLVVQVARALGSAEIVVTDVDARHRELAVAFGATATLEPGGSDLVSADVFVDCSGVPAAVMSGVGAVRAGGSAVLVGMGADEVTLPVTLLQNREISLTGTFRYSNTWPTAIWLAVRGQVDLDGLVTGRVDLDHVADALAPDPADQHVKIMVRPAGV
ncbi:MAG: alcohol dehydrogenase catalytic domain-containing protein [Propionibacteriales bacterium]|nr:alcohol dehydrogenase catalytic domain-containing protein [Propionibacteriales bacterium]